MDRTLIRVVLLMRLLGWVWLMILSVAVLMTSAVGDLGVAILVGTIVLATIGTVLTYVAARRRFLDRSWYVALDALFAVTLAGAGWFAGFDEFLVGGYPASWLFIMAYATGIRATTLAGVMASIVYAWLHVAMGLDQTRALGSVQFIVVAVVVGWAFDTLRDRDRLRMEAEVERAETEQELVDERERSARLQERTAMARRLHDSVLQTLRLIGASADNPSEVRYLSRVQERDLRRTIDEYQSPHTESFRARLLDAGAEVEDRFRVEVEQVVNHDAEMDERLERVIAATAEAMNNAARHSGAKTMDVFAEIREGRVQVNVRDRGSGFDPGQVDGGFNRSARERLEEIGGTVEVRSTRGRGTEVEIRLPLS